MQHLTPPVLALLGMFLVAFGVLAGGTWAQRQNDSTWDTVSTLIFVALAAAATVHLVLIGARQTSYNREARERLVCVEQNIDAIRFGQPRPDCDILWHY